MSHCAALEGGSKEELLSRQSHCSPVAAIWIDPLVGLGMWSLFWLLLKGGPHSPGASPEATASSGVLVSPHAVCNAPVPTSPHSGSKDHFLSSLALYSTFHSLSLSLKTPGSELSLGLQETQPRSPFSLGGHKFRCCLAGSSSSRAPLPPSTIGRGSGHRLIRVCPVA